MPFRKYLIVSFVLFAVLSLAGVVLEARYLKATVLAVAEKEAAFVARHLGVLYFRPGIFLNDAGDLEIPNPLLDQVKEDLETLGIVMLKIYDLDGKIVAATDPSYIGMEKGDNPSFLAAVAGKTVGKIADRKYYRSLYGQEANEDLLEVYVPLWSPGKNAPGAILELYRPWAHYRSLIHAGIIRTGIVAVGLSGVYCLLILLFVREAATRRQAEERHRESEENFQLLIEYSPVAMAIVTRDDRFEYLNHKFTETLGYDIAAIPDVEHWMAAAYPDPGYRQRMLERWEHNRQPAGSQAGPLPPAEYQVTDATGSTHTMEIHGARIGKRFLIAFNDITERLKLEHQLLHSQKMDCFGRLAAGVAHDFNNILTVIMGYTELLQSELEKDDPRRASVNVIFSAVNSAARLTSSLLVFSRKQMLNPRVFDLGELVIGVQRLVSRLIGEDITVETVIAPGKILVLADHGQMEQVLVNLATNARDALPRGGAIRIATGVETLDEGTIARVGAARPGSYATLAFSDTGVGMDEQTLEQVFEPFFTTKELGRGTGLGLSIVYGIVKQHGGGIAVASRPGAGTTFTIYLPRHTPDATSLPSEDAGENTPAAPGHGETILVAEDDAMVRRSSVQTLTAAGYRVQAAADGEEAVRIYDALDGKVDLLLLDVVMPRKSGKEAYDEIRARWGDVKALFLSGYAPDLAYREGMFDVTLPFLQKPVSQKTLLDKVRAVLDTGPQQP